MNRKSFIGRALLGVGAVIGLVKISEDWQEKQQLAFLDAKKKVSIIDWTDDQIREAFKLQFGLDSREVVRIKNMTGDVYGWAIIGGGTVTENGIIRGSFILRSSGDWINAREVGGTGYRVLSDDLSAYISELS